MSPPLSRVTLRAGLVAALLLAGTAWLAAAPATIAQEGSSAPEGVCVGWPEEPVVTPAGPAVVPVQPAAPAAETPSGTIETATSAGGPVVTVVAPQPAAAPSESGLPPTLWCGQDYYSPPER